MLTQLISTKIDLNQILNYMPNFGCKKGQIFPIRVKGSIFQFFSDMHSFLEYAILRVKIAL